MRHRQHPHSKHFVWMNNQCAICGKFIKSKGSYGHPKYCKDCYRQNKRLLSRMYILLSYLKYYLFMKIVEPIIIKVALNHVSNKHVHWKRFIRRNVYPYLY